MAVAAGDDEIGDYPAQIGITERVGTAFFQTCYAAYTDLRTLGVDADSIHHAWEQERLAFDWDYTASSIIQAANSAHNADTQGRVYLAIVYVIIHVLPALFSTIPVDTRVLSPFLLAYLVLKSKEKLKTIVRVVGIDLVGLIIRIIRSMWRNMRVTSELLLENRSPESLTGMEVEVGGCSLLFSCLPWLVNWICLSEKIPMSKVDKQNYAEDILEMCAVAWKENKERLEKGQQIVMLPYRFMVDHIVRRRNQIKH